ncbi:MAG TPA: DUF5615 family PIN-like protein [Thermoanaerobaculia bacterium]
MKILLDECVDWRLLRDLSNHYVRTVKQEGWEHIKNGALLRLAATRYDVFITVDGNLPYQQHVAALGLMVIVLKGQTTRLPDLRELLSALHETLATGQPGETRILSWRDKA